MPHVEQHGFISGQIFEVPTRDALPFRHMKYIGHGKSAVIEKVSHDPTKQLFALKTFRRYYGRQFEDAKRAFKNEVNIMERLSSHKHIIQVEGTYICDRELGILLSPVANEGDLAVYLSRVVESGLTPEKEIVLTRAFGCLASGLAHIHRHTIRHKDIKPQNILIHDGRVIYTDFGISFDADQQDTTTVGYPGVFTRRYCAPEVQDWANRNRKSDVFSLGCVFGEVLDVLEPSIGIRSMDSLPYFEKLEEIRKKLLRAEVTENSRNQLLRICHDMLDPDQNDRIDTDTVLERIARLGNHKSNTMIALFCDDCLSSANCKGIAIQELEDDEPSSAPPDDNLAIELVISELKKQEITTTSEKKRKKKKTASSVNIGYSTRNNTARYFCKSCGELGHTANKCPNECWACGELYHKSADCPNKCWDCDEVGHFARDCPNKCWTCDEVGHFARDCPNICFTCGEVGHSEQDCEDECFVCGKLGHSTLHCKGKCHKCGKIGHWTRDCDDACSRCGDLGHPTSRCPSKRKKGRRKDACFECGRSGHWAAQCPEKQKRWRPIFDQVPQGPYRPKSRRRS